ncbi:DUF262 domain-containing protein [Caldilinea sp.]|uniref:GmrSD restriction endonuclease domain-containing protein n=1 Tax=Caldilinea sp. TaxID=2293560 RepID=UPI002C4DD329|nr:DUF262 domain-containing protein [Caldilinea sp.]
MEISTILNQIDLGAMALPEFQRGYVWNRSQVREFMASLYRRHPVGGLLVWITKTEQANVRGGQMLAAGNVELILDGQQRVTSLYGIIRGTPPPFFEGNVDAFTDLYFNVADESFEFYGPIKMADNPQWVSVTDLMRGGLGPYLGRMFQHKQLQAYAETYIERLNRLHGVKDIHIHIEKVAGPDKNVDVVVEIFNKLNSGGTKLSKGDLALARICAEWTDARLELRTLIEKWYKAGFNFDMDWLLRNVNAVVTGKALFLALKDVPASEFQAGLKQTDKAVDYLINVISGRLGLDHDRVLGSRYAFPIMCSYLAQRGGRFDSAKERDRLLYWYVHSLLWGRYAGSTESVLMQDLTAMERPGDAIDGLIDQLRIWRGDLVVRPENFASWSVGARFYPMLYLLTRVGEARDWDTGLPLRAELLGKTNRLEIHHIFPKSQLYKRGYGRPEVNALANYCFLTQATNLGISNTLPEIYFPEVESRHPGALASQWVPLDPQLWRMENFIGFLAERRRLLAEAANVFLDSLIGDSKTPSRDIVLSGPAPISMISIENAPMLDSIADEDEEIALLEVNIWIAEQGLPEGEMLYEIVEVETGAAKALLDLAWPEGIQTRYSDPVALLLNEEIVTLELASAAGFRCFTDIATFRDYVEKEILAVDAIAAD